MDRPDIVHYFWANPCAYMCPPCGSTSLIGRRAAQSGAEKGIGDPNAKLHGMSLGTAALSAAFRAIAAT